MREFTEEKLKKVQELLNKNIGVSGKKGIFTRIFEKGFVNPILKSERIFAVIPEDKVEEFMRGLKPAAFKELYTPEMSKRHPSLWEIGIRKIINDNEKNIPKQDDLDLLWEKTDKEVIKEKFITIIKEKSGYRDGWEKSVLETWKRFDEDTKAELMPEVISEIYNDKNYAYDRKEELKSILEETSEEIQIQSTIRTIKQMLQSDESNIQFYSKKGVKDLMRELTPEAQRRGLYAVLLELDSIKEVEGSNYSEKARFLENILEITDPKVIEEFNVDIYSKLKQIQKSYPKEVIRGTLKLYSNAFYKTEIFEKITPEELDIEFENGTFTPEFFVEYTKYALENDRYATTNNRFVGQIQQMVLNDKINNSFLKGDREGKNIDELKRIFKELKDSEKEPDMSQYDEHIDSLGNMEKSQFLKFTADLKRYRNIHGIFPEKYCDYMIKQALDVNSSLNSGLRNTFSEEMLKRVMEDKGRHILAKDGIDDYLVTTTSDLGKNVSGEHNSSYKTIKISEDSVARLSAEYCDSINTVFHECRHAVQDRDIKSGEIRSSTEYKMVKEAIIRRENREFYDKNYEHMVNEADARLAGVRGEVKLLKKLGLSDRYIAERMGKSVFETFKEEVIGDQEKIDLRNHKKVFEDGNSEYVNVYFSKMLLQKPEILREFPILQLEYDKNGKRRPGLEILQNFEKELALAREDKSQAKASNIRMFPAILKDRFHIQGEQVLENVDMLMEYEPSSRVMAEYRDSIIKREILKPMKFWKKEGKIILNIDKQSDEEGKKILLETAKKLDEFAKKNPELAISEKILQTIDGILPKENEIQNSAAEIKKLYEIDQGITDEERKDGINTISQIKDNIKEEEPKQPEQRTANNDDFER